MSRSSNWNKNNNKGKTDGASKPQSGSSGASGEYFLSDQAKRDVANYNWYNPLGMKFPYYLKTVPNAEITSVPLLAVFDVCPTIGVTNDPTSATNLQARTMYNYIVRINNKNVSYEPVDLQIAILAEQSLYSFLVWAGRLYAMANTMSTFHRAIPEIWLEANNVDVEDMRKKRSDYRAWLNNFSARAGLLAMPANMSFYNRPIELFSNVYADENNIKSQFYMFRPTHFWAFDEFGPNGGRLIPVPLLNKEPSTIPASYNQWGDNITNFPARGKMKVDDIIAMGNRLLEPLLSSEEIGNISADIYKAYGPGNLIKMPIMAEDAQITPWHDYKILSMIENMNIIPKARTINSSGSAVGMFYPTLDQDPNFNKGNLTFKYYGYIDSTSNITAHNEVQQGYAEMYSQNYMLNMHNDDTPSTDDVMNVTRWIPTTNLNMTEYGPAALAEVTSCGTELITDLNIYRLKWSSDKSNNTTYDVTNMPSSIAYGNSMFGIYTGVLDRLVMLEQFNYHPMFRYLDIVTYGSSSAYYERLFASLDQYTFLSHDNIRRLHDVALAGQFNVPGYTSMTIK